MSKDKGTQTVQQNSAPWAAQQPYLTDIFGHAQNIYNSGAPAVYTGQRIANIDPAQTQALNATEQRAMAGNPLLPQAQGALYDTLGGAYLSAGNPYFSAMADQLGDQVTRKYNQAFSGDDASFGSPAHQAALATGLSSALAPLAYQNYGQERAYQNAAIGAAPGLAEADYNDFAHLGQSGDARRALEQGLITADQQQFNELQNQPWNALANYAHIVQGNYGGSSTTTQPVQGGSLAGGLLGAGLMGASLIGSGGLSGLGSLFGGGLGSYATPGVSGAFGLIGGGV